MLAEVIAIGDELTSGQRLDTNSQWLSERLGELGIRVMYHTTVADDMGANERIFREAVTRADLIIATGGLGPTADDLTRDAIALATGRELELHEPSLQHIRGLFERRGREMPERNIVQARFPQGSRVVHNPNGSAPGIDLDVPRDGRSATRIFALPGVPAEMREMWHETVGPAIRESLGDSLRIICHRRIKCFGAGESAIEEMLPDLIRRGRSPTVGITASNATITLRISAQAESVDASHVLMRSTIETIYECLGSLIYGEEDDELQDVIVRHLKEAGKSLATIEWGTGGLVSNWLNEADPGGRAYIGGIIVRNRDAFQGRRAGDETLSTSENQLETVAAMANSCHHDFQADHTLAIGPFPTSDDTSDRSMQLHLALATSEGITTKSVDFGGHPAIIRPRSAKQALNFLRLELDKKKRRSG